LKPPKEAAISLGIGPTIYRKLANEGLRTILNGRVYDCMIRPMFDTICTFPLSADLFAQAVHPTEPLVAVGLSSGHVATLKLPPQYDGGEETVVVGREGRGSKGTDVVETVWKTRRHHGSCRCLAYSVDGRQLFSAGTDGIAKAADWETGRVTGKVAVPLDPNRRGEEVDAPTVIHVISPQTLLLGTDSGTLHLFDLRDPAPSVPLEDQRKTAFTNHKPNQTHYPHTDYISSLSPLPPSSSSTSGYSKQFITTGGTTLALTDLRRGVLVKSDDQEDILLSSLYVTGLPVKKSSGSSVEKALVGGGDGVITLWEKGQWDDQDERIIVSRDGETLDVLTTVPDDIGGFGKQVAVGLGDGTVKFVQLGQNKILAEVQHDEVEGVVGLDFDVSGRMISGGGHIVKVWRKYIETEDDGIEVDADVATKRAASSNDNDDENDEPDSAEDSEEDDKPWRSRKKRKRGKGPSSEKAFNFAGLD